jgi:thiamine-monophosphate kinase
MTRSSATRTARDAGRRAGGGKKQSTARLAAVQALYQVEMTGASAEDVLAEFHDHRFEEEVDGIRLTAADRGLLEELVCGAAVERDELDDMLAAVLDEDWPVERLETLLRIVLRAGTWELSRRLETPGRVVIAEYVDLADAFFGGKEPGLVNGVLDRLARELRPEEFASQGADPARTGSSWAREVKRGAARSALGMPMMPKRNEFELIAHYFAPLAEGAPGAQGLLNDAAVFDSSAGDSLVVTLDAMVEGVHFLPEDPPELIGRKLLRVNLSDLAAMGALPRGYLLAAAFPKDIDEAWIGAFTAGLAEDQEAFGVMLYGGDTVSTPGPLTLSLTAFGEVPKGQALSRATARAGDDVYVSGTIGDGALGLDALRGGLSALSEVERAALAVRYRLPEPRLALGRRLAESGLATAAIDVSDGLMADLGHIAAVSRVAAEIVAETVPLSQAGRAALASDPALLSALLTGGDDYELLFTAQPERAGDLAELARQLDLPLTRIGHVTGGSGVRALDAAGQDMGLSGVGWSHF